MKKLFNKLFPKKEKPVSKLEISIINFLLLLYLQQKEILKVLEKFLERKGK